jgi:hypothetical protein
MSRFRVCQTSSANLRYLANHWQCRRGRLAGSIAKQRRSRRSGGILAPTMARAAVAVYIALLFATTPRTCPMTTAAEGQPLQQQLQMQLPQHQLQQLQQ